MFAGFFCSSIGKKYIVGISGVVWALFALGHMGGNLLIFAGAEAYNAYGHALTHSPIIWIARIALVGTFFLHVIWALVVTYENRRAKASSYQVASAHEKGSGWIAQTMVFQGSLILLFVVLHLGTFTFGTYYVSPTDPEVRDLYRLVIEVFQKPIYVGFYLVCLAVLGFHLRHGVESVFQSLGVLDRRFNLLIKRFAIVYSVVVATGFISLPIYVFFFAA